MWVLWKLFSWLMGLLVCAVFFAVLVFIGLYYHYANDLPKITTLADYRPPVITTIRADDNRKIGEFYEQQRRVIPLSEMPENLKNAFIAAEDSRFYHHPGVDFFSIVRAFYRNLQAGDIVQGGSTITQQVTKSFLLTPERSYERKVKEAILAFRIDSQFTKDQILFLYLNQIYLGTGAYGVESAAQTYFGKSAGDLNLAECALLAGLPQAPSRYSPFTYPDKAKARQVYTLNRMAEEGYITKEEAAAAAQAPLDIQHRRNWFRETVPEYTDHILKILVEMFGKQKVYNDGLEVTTSVNIDMQHSAQAAVEKGLRELEKRQGYKASEKSSQRVQGALLCIETGTGLVKAMVGGRDYVKSQFNRAIQAQRQPGSAFKPIIYAAALDKGYTVSSVLIDAPIAFDMPGRNEVWKPENYDNKFRGRTLFRQGLIDSRNVVTIKILQGIGVKYAIDYARKLGVTAHLDRNLSLALGSSGVSLMELVEAYTVFANQGRLITPCFIKKVVDRDGEVLMEYQPNPRQVIEDSTAYIMTYLMEEVIKYGTGKKVKELNRPAAGKTGTTNDLMDAWFVGYTPELAAGVWVGFDQRKPLGPKETGGKAAAPIWLEFMRRALEGKPVKVFNAPDSVVFAKINPYTGYRISAESAQGVLACFKEGTGPKVPVEQKPEAPITETEDFFKGGF